MEDVYKKIKVIEDDIKNAVNINQTFFKGIMQTYDKTIH